MEESGSEGLDDLIFERKDTFFKVLLKEEFFLANVYDNKYYQDENVKTSKFENGWFVHMSVRRGSVCLSVILSECTWFPQAWDTP